jgi:hypothetical protein
MNAEKMIHIVGLASMAIASIMFFRFALGGIGIIVGTLIGIGAGAVIGWMVLEQTA